MTFKRLRLRFGIPAALLAVLAMVALPAAASADALGANAEYFEPEAPIYPVALAEGPDGNMWFTDPVNPISLSGLTIGKVTPAGVVTKYSPGLSGGAWGIAKGPDGNIWFTEPGATKKVGHINTSGSSLEEISVPGMTEEVAFKSFITAGPDGNLWVNLNENGIARITPAGVVTEFKSGLNAGANVCSITAGPDGNVWFGDCNASNPSVGRITPAGVITEYEVKGAPSNSPESIALGSDGRLWFPAANAADERIGAITTEGVATYYKTPPFPVGFGLDSLTAGPDGNIWAAETSGENEQQNVTLKGEAGVFKLGFEGKETGATFEGNLTSGSKLIKSIPSTAAISKNELVTSGATGFPAGVIRVNAIKSPTEIEITTAATATTAGASFSSDLAISSNTNTYSTTTVKEALEKLSTIGTKNILVLGGGAPPTTTRSVTFQGKFARANVPLLTCNGSNLTGGSEPGCTVETVVSPYSERLFRIKPSGKMKGFSLKAATALQAFPKTNTLAAGPGGNIWYTTEGITPAIGKFGTEAAELIVEKEGTGNGTVVSNPAGIECDPTCSADFEKGSKVTLTASADSNSLFMGWKGCESGGAIGRQCKVTLNTPITIVKAKFITAYDVLVSRKGTGLGKVGSSPGGVLCLANCSSTSAKFKEQANVTLTATPSKHFVFAGWSGDCSGTGTCVLSTLSADKAVEAEFTEVAKHLLAVTKKGGGEGTVKAKQAGINCGVTCSSMAAAYYEGEVVELLVPVPGKGSTFAGWSGSGCTGTGTCLVTMSSAKSVEAEFK